MISGFCSLCWASQWSVISDPEAADGLAKWLLAKGLAKWLLAKWLLAVDCPWK